jgi:hypothetical protein
MENARTLEAWDTWLFSLESRKTGYVNELRRIEETMPKTNIQRAIEASTMRDRLKDKISQIDRRMAWIKEKKEGDEALQNDRRERLLVAGKPIPE